MNAATAPLDRNQKESPVQKLSSPIETGTVQYRTAKEGGLHEC